MWEFVRGLRANPLVTRIAAIAAIGGFLFGYDTGVISGALLYIKRDFRAGPLAQEAVVSVLLLGAALGAVVSGYLADRISRRNTKIISGATYVVGALASAFAVNLPMLVGARFVLGLAVGTASFVSPMYISEVAEPRMRGGLTSFNQLAVTIGIAAAYLVDFAFKDAPGNWRWMLGVAVIPGAALAIGMLTVPKTPRWLVEHARVDDARQVLERLRAGSAGSDPDDELTGIRDTVEGARQTRLRDLISPRVRPLLLTGTVGLGVALLVLAAYFGIPSLRHDAGWLALVGLLLYIASFAIGLGPVFWLMISEIFPQRLRSKAMSATTVANWAANFVVSATFLTLVGALSRPGTFVLYAVIAAASVVFFAYRVPETSNRTLEDIQRELVGGGALS